MTLLQVSDRPSLVLFAQSIPRIPIRKRINQMIASLETIHDDLSPFDLIRRLDDLGVEFWLARELMPLLGYSRWAEFKNVVERGKLACQNTGNTVSEHFSGLTLKSVGRPAEDWSLSRLGAYLVAMNGDPRKPEVAAAQSYFAFKTREAEVQPKSQVETVTPVVRNESVLVANARMTLELAEKYEAQQIEIARVEALQQEQSKRIDQIEADRAIAREALRALPPSNVEVPPETMDMKVKRVVNAYCAETGSKHDEVYNSLYQQYSYRFHRRVAKKEGEKSMLQAFVRLGLVESLYGLAIELLTPQASRK